MAEDIDRPVVIYCTFPDRDIALRIAGELVDSKLAACVNVLGAITSIYNWEGARQQETEVAALVKTRAGLASAVTQKVAERHPYDIPAVLVLAVEDGLPAFLDWIMQETQAIRAR